MSEVKADDLNRNQYSDSVMDSRARRAAKRAGLIAQKSRQRQRIDNYGGYTLVYPYNRQVMYGVRYELSAEEVIDICSDLAEEA